MIIVGSIVPRTWFTTVIVGLMAVDICLLARSLHYDAACTYGPPCMRTYTLKIGEKVILTFSQFL